jgi:hypothetical protein
MKEHGDFWDHVLAFIIQAHEECSKMHAAGGLSDFEKAWRNPIAQLSGCGWFTDAKPIARTLATQTITGALTNMIEYYRFSETLLCGH